MTNPVEQARDAQKSLPVKRREPKVNPDNPWVDDLLDREQIATRLTNLVATQEPPLTISLHGEWGTGKTFMLRRWQKSLENQRYRAIYFNAWQDDFCDDPLLATIGQLAEYFKQEGLRGIAANVAKIALPLIRANAGNLLKGVGVPVQLDTAGQGGSDPMSDYRDQRATKDQFKNELAKLAAKVSEETGHPLVFIVDELDRCRPTFAIELLERIKHIFDVPHLVFVFGVNRDELCKSLSSIYGEINADVYLRRFFDFEFNLPEADSQGFAGHLMDVFQIQPVFQQLAAAAGGQNPIYDYNDYRVVLPRLWSGLGLSLRDIDYGIRLLVLMTRNVPVGESSHPYLLAVLIAMKFKNADYYRMLVTGEFRASEVMDYLSKEVGQRRNHGNLETNLDRIEGFLYCAEHPRPDSYEDHRGLVELELEKLTEGVVAPEVNFLSARAKSAGRDQAQRIWQAVREGSQKGIDHATFGDLATLIDTYQAELRR